MTKIEKTPSMPLYGKDVFDDEAFARLTLAGEALFWRLAWWQWQEGSIPADPSALLDKLPHGKVKEARKAISEALALFAVCDDERRRNLRLEEHRDNLATRRARHSEGAQKTNAKRWGKGIATESLSDRLATEERFASRVATASATAIASPVLSEEGAGETKPRAVDLQGVAVILDAFPPGFAPHPAMLLPLLELLPVDGVLEIVRRYGTKGIEYVTRCAENEARRRKLTAGLDSSGLAIPQPSRRDALRLRIDNFQSAHGTRPRDARRESWDTQFTASLGFTPDEWTEATDEQIERWASLLGGVA